MTDLTQLRLAAREIFDEALRAVDPAAAVSRTVRVYESRLIVQERASEIPAGGGYSIAIGKAAYEMAGALEAARSEEHTSELQSQSNLVCRLLLEKKKKKHVPVPTVTLCP